MKKIIVLTMLFFNISIAFGISSPNPSLEKYFDEQISEFSKNEHHNSSIQYSDNVTKLENVLNLFKNYGFFDKDNYGKGNYFKMFYDFSNEHTPTNFITKALFPYNNDKLLEDGNGISILYSGNNLLYHAGGFILEGKIQINSGNLVHMENNDYKGKLIKYSEIYIMPKNLRDLTLYELPYYNDGKIFIGCVQSDIYSNNLKYVKGYFSGEKLEYSSKKIYFNNKDYDLSNYKNGDDIKIKLYIDMNYIPQKRNLPCENSWLLRYKVL